MLKEIWAHSYFIRPFLFTVALGLFFAFNKNLAYNCLARFGRWQVDYQANRRSVTLALFNAGAHAYLDVSLRAQEMIIVWAAAADTRRGIPTSHEQAYAEIEEVFALVECSLPGPLQKSLKCPEASRGLSSQLNTVLMAPSTATTMAFLLVDLIQLGWYAVLAFRPNLAAQPAMH